MGLDVNRFVGGTVDEELLCPICSGVLENPVQAPVCEHAFCNGCISEWLRLRPTCPVDRMEFTHSQLKPVPRILKNLLARLEISCDNQCHGCDVIVKLDLLPHHLKECEHNPKRPVTCTQGCGQTVAKDEMKNHNCVKELRAVVKAHEQKISELQQEVRDCKYQLAEQRREINVLRDLMRNFRPPMASSGATGVQNLVTNCPGESGSTAENHSLIAGNQSLSLRTVASHMQDQDEVVRWCNSLTRSKVTRWGGMISTPDDDLQAQIKRSLSESGCPSHILNDLMDNAHERRWPPGLLTLETRQMNRRQYEQYVCRRVPNKQAVVVMACDNAHMSDDMILEPGLVMIFAHGIE